MMDARAQSFAHYRPEMDGLRAIACLIVLVMHSIGVNDQFRSFDIDLRGIARIGVWLFFVLSAQLLTLRLLSAPLTPGAIAHYGVGRLLRIVPAFVVAVLLYAAMGEFDLRTPEKFWSVLLLQDHAGHLWTIPPEMLFYVALPVLAIVLVAIGSVSRIAALLALAAIAGGLTWFFPPLQTPNGTGQAAFYAICFGAGVVAAYAAHSFKIARVPWWPAWLALLGLVAFVLAVRAGPGGGDALINKHFVFGPLWGVIAFTVYVNGSRWLSNPVLVRIGEAAFSIYLFHWAILRVFEHMPLAIAAPSVIVGSILVGIVLYHVLELPIYRLRLALRSGGARASAEPAQ